MFYQKRNELRFNVTKVIFKIIRMVTDVKRTTQWWQSLSEVAFDYFSISNFLAFVCLLAASQVSTSSSDGCT